MKKNYLLAALVGALVLSGCNGNSTSSSSTSSSTITNSSSTSSADPIPTVESAAETLALDYTVEYTVAATGEEYSVYVEDTDNTSEVYFYVEQTNDGYYVDTNNDVYYFYMNGYSKPVYNTNSKLEEENADLFRSLIDVKTVFTDASWDLVSSDKKETVYYTEDVEVISTCVFLNETIGVDTVESVEVTINSRGKFAGYTTFDASGEVVATSTFKRLGTTYAVEDVPVLDDNMDTALVNRWVIYQEDADTLLGGAYDIFEVFADGTLAQYVSDEEGNVTGLGEVFTFYAPMGNGTYAFMSESENVVIMQSLQGAVIFATLEAATEKMAQAIAVSYFELMFLVGAQQAGFIAEPMYEDDEMYASCVTELSAAGAYYVYQVDENEEVVDLMIVTQFVNIQQMVDVYFDGDETFYNGCSLGGYVYANFAVTAAATNESVVMMYAITSLLYPEYVAVDPADYIAVEPGVSALDYVISYMTSEGYEYNNAANPGAYEEDITYIMNALNGVTEETEEEATEEEATTASLIIVENGTAAHPVTTEGETTEGETTEGDSTEEEPTATCTDVYIFHKDGQYAAIVVFDTTIALWGNYGLTNVTTLGYGYFSVIGEIYGALTTWGNAQPAPEA